MAVSEIATLRSFNRLVTERIGVLHAEYLGRGRSLGASRVLWEIGADGTDIKTLRSRLGLDSGYLSRLLGALEREGLIEITSHETDMRVRRLQLTPAGRMERAELDRRSDDLAESLLAPLNSAQRRQLVEAVAVVDRLLTAGLVDVTIEDPRSPDAQYCVRSYFLELDSRFDGGFDPMRSISGDYEELTEPAGLFLVARLRDEPVGCGALKLHAGREAEVKRMWVAEAARGIGLGRRILCELETQAIRRGATVARLETNKALGEAISLYRTSGYTEVEAFNDEPYAHHWFEKDLERP